MIIATDTIFGRYRIIARLGAGGMASVYRAFEPSPPREVALKLIDASLALDPVFRARFRREAAVLAALEHPNIVPIYATGEEAGQPYICYRYIRGGTLTDVLGQPLALAQVIALLAPVAEALDFAHRHGVVHRDIKPANILLTPPDDNGQRTPIVADFGVARLLEHRAAEARIAVASARPVAIDGTLIIGSAAADATLIIGSTAADGTQAIPSAATRERTLTETGLTQVGVGLGTPAYMAPEQVSGQPIDGRADQYALAITAYQLLTGTVPFQASTPIEVAFMQVHEPLPPPNQRGANLPPAAEQALLKALAKDPADRHASCAAFIAALAAAPAPVPAAVPARPAPLWRRAAGFVLDSFVALILGSFLAVPFALLLEPAGEFAVLALVWFGYAWVGNAIGGSLGQRAFGLRVIAAHTGGRPGWRRGFARSAAAALSTSCVGLGYLWARFRHDRHTWHDSIAATSVVREEDAASAMAPPFRSRSRRLRVASWLAVAAGTALLLALAASPFREPNLASTRGFVVGGSSMDPTLQDGDRVAIDTNARTPARGAVIVFRQTLDSKNGSPPVTILKRVVAVPGDTVDISGGHLSVNGVAATEPYATDPTNCFVPADCHVTLSRGEYYVLGDNRPDSSDSRSYGPISAADIVGTVRSLPKHATSAATAATALSASATAPPLASETALPATSAPPTATSAAAAVPSATARRAPAAATQPPRTKTAAPTYTPGKLPAWVRIVAEDNYSTSSVADVQKDLLDAFDLYHQLYGLAPQTQLSVHLVSDSAFLPPIASSIGFSPSEIADLQSGKTVADSFLRYSGLVDMVIYLPKVTHLRGTVAFQFAVYAAQAIAVDAHVSEVTYWFKRGFAEYWRYRLDPSAGTLRAIAVDDARAGTTPALSSLDTSLGAMTWEDSQSNGATRAEAKSEAAVDYLAQQLGDGGMAQLLQKLNAGTPFLDAVQAVTGLTADQLEAAVDASLKQ